MNKRQGSTQFSESQDAVRRYNEFVESKGVFPGNHKARVLVSKGNHTYRNILQIGTRIETNYSMITICGDIEFSREYHPEYKNEYQVFEYISPGTLIVRDTEDVWGNPIEIDISYYE